MNALKFMVAVAKWFAGSNPDGPHLSVNLSLTVAFVLLNGYGVANL